MEPTEQVEVRCPVTIMGVKCDTVIEEGAGALVFSQDQRKAWLVCKPCGDRGVRINDVNHVEPVLDLTA